MIKENTLRLTIFFLVIATDQLAKFIIRSMGGFYICNLGIAFGVEIPNPVFFMIWTLFLFFAFCYFFGKCNFFLKGGGKSENLYLCLILGGGISNLFDRIIFGCVADYINLGFFPVFNLADTFISFGAIMIIWRIVTNKK